MKSHRKKLESSLWVRDGRMERGECFDLDFAELAVFSDRSPEREGENEDAAFIFLGAGSSLVLAVADGVGARPCAREAAQQALQCLEKNLRSIDGEEASEWRGAILNSVEEANRHLLEWGLGAATTLSLMEIHREVLRSYHVGDSPMMVMGQRGVIKFQTIPHSPTGYGVEAGLLTEGEALRHAESHLVSNVLGSMAMRIELGPELKLAPRDTVLLATDGVTDNLLSAEIVDLVRKGSLETAVAQLQARCLQRMENPKATQPSKPDDRTFLLFRLKSR